MLSKISTADRGVPQMFSQKTSSVPMGSFINWSMSRRNSYSDEESPVSVFPIVFQVLLRSLVRASEEEPYLTSPVPDVLHGTPGKVKIFVCYKIPVQVHKVFYRTCVPLCSHLHVGYPPHNQNSCDKAQHQTMNKQHDQINGKLFGIDNKT